MDETLRKLLDDIPERPPRSKLEPHAEVIRELRKKRRTYQEIAAFFKEHLQVPVAPSTLHAFVKTRARQARNRTMEAVGTTASRPPEFQAGHPLETAPVPASPLGRPDIRESIPAVWEQPSATPKEQPLFQFDAQEPFLLNPKLEQK
jgi:hypothetical protein